MLIYFLIIIVAYRLIQMRFFDKKEEKYEVSNRFSNGITQVVTKFPDKLENKYLLIDKDYNVLTDRLLSGIVNINEENWEVYENVALSPEGYKERTGVFNIKTGFDWNAKTPRQKVDEAYAIFRAKLDEQIELMGSDCFCKYPRIIDYISNRNNSQESFTLKSLFESKFLEEKGYIEDKEAGCFIIDLTCKVCSSEYKHHYRDRGIDRILEYKTKVSDFTGMPAEEFAPNFLSTIHDELFFNTNFIHREKLFKADCQQVIDYLFERR